ncbi:MAG: diguanylate cyclase, partial [Alphaproteobacteria bacterium]|nr:diguanylate cyclase [Alphaproteobacteria bacterium]
GATGEKLRVTISVGLAITGYPEDTLEALLKRVDDALYAAKNGGRNRVVAAPPRASSLTRGLPVAVAS